MSWKDDVYRLYFDEHMKINDIAKKVGKSRQSVSAFLNTKNTKDERERRKNETKIKRNRKNRENMKRIRIEKRDLFV